MMVTNMGWRFSLAKKNYAKAKEKYADVKEHRVAQAFIGKPPKSYRRKRRFDDELTDVIAFGGLMRKKRKH